MMASRREDEYFMSRALSLALRGMGRTSPNPMVGCVIVRDGRIIGEGFHHACGSDHAEVDALKNAASRGEDVRGATVYVSLEPCCHHGRTPPCAHRLVSEGVGRVVAAMTDPNPKVSSGGLAVLRSAGIDVSVPCLEDEAKKLNRGFIRVQTLGRPWISIKAAAGLDGRTALSNGESKWITSPEARQLAHLMRASHDAVMVGVGTVLADDPELTVRSTDGANPLRVIIDSNLRTPVSAKALRAEGRCVIMTACGDMDKISRLKDAGAEVEVLPSRDGRADLGEAVTRLAGMGVLSVMVEGGAVLQTSLIRAGLADSLSLFTAPRIMGSGIGLGAEMSLNSVAESLMLADVTARRVGCDMLLEGRFKCSPDL